MITLEEKKLVLKVLDNYPVGVHPSAWGHGEMAIPIGRLEELEDNEWASNEHDFLDPHNFNGETLEKFG